MGSAIRHRNTRQRQAVLDELKELTCHPTASDLYQRLRDRLPRISLGTVYRNLELLTETGAIQKLQMAGSEARFDGNTARHHVRCVRCGCVDDVVDIADDLTDLLTERGFSRLSGYEILNYQLVISGVCPSCGARPAGTDEVTSQTTD